MIHRRFVTYHYTPISLVQGANIASLIFHPSTSQHSYSPRFAQRTVVTWGRIYDLVLCWSIFTHRVHLSCIKPHNLLLNSFFNVTCIFLSCRICLLFLFVIIKTAWPVSPYGPDVFPKILRWHTPYRDPPLYRGPTIYREIILYRGCICLSNANFMFKCKILR